MDIPLIVKTNRVALFLACMAGLAIILVSENSYHRAIKTLDELGAMAQARTTIQRVESSLLAAETSQLGYLMTSRKDYLEPFQKALTSINEALLFLDQHVTHVPEEKKLVEKLRTLTESKISELELTIRLHDEGKAAAAREMVLSGIGKGQMSDTLAVSAEILRHESSRVAEGRKNLYHTLWIGRLGLASACAIAVLSIFMYLRQNSILL